MLRLLKWLAIGGAAHVVANCMRKPVEIKATHQDQIDFIRWAFGEHEDADVSSENLARRWNRRHADLLCINPEDPLDYNLIQMWNVWADKKYHKNLLWRRISGQC